MTDDNAVELYRRYRPARFKDMLGQEEAIACLVSLGKRNQIPHVLLLSGSSGTGKTTVARILRVKLGCSDHDFQEINAADFRGIDTVRQIREQMSLAPIGGRCRVYVLDEVAAITGAASDAMLKLLEDTPETVYFFLCTTDPQKLKATLRTRCTEIKFKPLGVMDLRILITRVSKSEGFALDEDVCDAISELATGSARKALVLLHAVMGVEDKQKQLEIIKTYDSRHTAIELARVLLNGRSNWRDAAKVLAGIDEDPEQVRRLILGYARKVLIESRNDAVCDRAAAVIANFRHPLYDLGAAGLALGAWDSLAGVK